MTHKLDMGRAWSEAVALLKANKDVVLIVAGVFFFLPHAIGALLVPQWALIEARMQALGTEPDPEQVIALLASSYGGVWWVFAAMLILQAIGVLGLLALLTDRSRPTVGEALAFGAKALFPYILAQILISLIVLGVALVLVGLGALGGAALAALMALITFVIAIYLWVKFSLVSPVIAIDHEMNPVNALARSWRMTKGNSLRLAAFYLLLIVALVVIATVAGLIFAAFGLLGEEVGILVGAIGGAIVNMAMVVVLLAVLAAVHRQLAGRTSEAISETFE